MPLPRLASAMAALLTAACATAQPVASADTLDASYSVAGGNWDDGSTLYVFTKPKDVGGKLAICGLWTVANGTPNTKFFNDRVIAAGSASVGDARVVQGLGGLRKAKYVADLNGQPVSCLVTGLAWDPGYTDLPVDVRLPRQNTGRRGSAIGVAVGGTIGAPRNSDIAFRQTAVPNIIK